MPSADAVCALMGVILCISGVRGRENTICALKGSSVDLFCSSEKPPDGMKWFTVHRNDSDYVMTRLSTDQSRVTYNASEGSDFTLTINDLRETDFKKYCCRENTDRPELCWKNRTELHVADLQVKVLPSTEGHTVTLMCSTSCPLTENPAAYIWYKNREFLYEDWSPWYQQLVSSEEAVRYSCAIKGYEDLRAPEVSVDSVTSACFNVTYAKGKMCSYAQESEDEPCSITYPTELRAQKTPGKDFVTVTCNTSCPEADAHTAFRWYWDRELFGHCEDQDVTVFGLSSQQCLCAVKGHEGLRSDEVCAGENMCASVNYITRRICALEGSSVNISCVESNPKFASPLSWSKVKRRDERPEVLKQEDAGRLEFHRHAEQHTLTINNLTKDDSAEYVTRSDIDLFGAFGVTLVVTGVKVTFTPSAVVTEGQRVTLTCSTSCPLDADYTWTFNSRPLNLPENQNKQLALDPVGKQHAGNYSCAVAASQNITSSERTLTVMPLKSMAIMNAVKLTLLSLTPIALFLHYLMIRKKKTQTSAAELADKVRTKETDPLYDNIGLSTMNPAARAEPAEQQEDAV